MYDQYTNTMASRMTQLLNHQVLPGMMNSGQLQAYEANSIANTFNAGVLQQMVNSVSVSQQAVDANGRTYLLPPRNYTDPEISDMLWKTAVGVLQRLRAQTQMPNQMNNGYNGMPMYPNNTTQPMSPPMANNMNGYGSYPNNYQNPYQNNFPQQMPMYNGGQFSGFQQQQDNIFGNGALTSIYGDSAQQANVVPSQQVPSQISFQTDIPTRMEIGRPELIQPNIADVARNTNSPPPRQPENLSNGVCVKGGESTRMDASDDLTVVGVDKRYLKNYAETAIRLPDTEEIISRKQALTIPGIQTCVDTAVYRTTATEDIRYNEVTMESQYTSWDKCKHDLYGSGILKYDKEEGRYVNAVTFDEYHPLYMPYDRAIGNLQDIAEDRNQVLPNISGYRAFHVALAKIDSKLADVFQQRFLEIFNDLARIWLSIGDNANGSSDRISVDDFDDVKEISKPINKLPEAVRRYSAYPNWYTNMVYCVTGAMNSVSKRHHPFYLDMTKREDQAKGLLLEDASIRYGSMDGRAYLLSLNKDEPITEEVMLQLKKRTILLRPRTILHTKLPFDDKVVNLPPGKVVTFDKPVMAIDQIIMNYIETHSSRGEHLLLELDLEESNVKHDRLVVGFTLNEKIAYYHRT